MRHRLGRRACIAVISVGVLLSSVALPPAAAGQPVPAGAAAVDGPGHSDDAPLRGKIIRVLRHMTLEEKVGQLFVVEVFGQDANTVSPAMAARNQALYG